MCAGMYKGHSGPQVFEKKLRSNAKQKNKHLAKLSSRVLGAV